MQQKLKLSEAKQMALCLMIVFGPIAMHTREISSFRLRTYKGISLHTLPQVQMWSRLAEHSPNPFQNGLSRQVF